MSDNTNKEIISQVEAKPENATSVEISTEKKTQPNPFLTFIASIFKFIYRIIKRLVIKFLELEMKSKIFVIFAIAFFILGLIIGHAFGFNAGKENMKNEFEQLNKPNVDKIDLLMKKIIDLENSR